MSSAKNNPYSNELPKIRILRIVGSSDDGTTNNVVQINSLSKTEFTDGNGQATGQSKVSLLLIEDNPADAELFRDQLDCVDGFEFDISVTESLQNATKVLAENSNFAVIIVDLTLPDSSGLDTFIRLKGTITGIPIIVLTGLEDRTVSLKALELGAANYLIKQKMNAIRIATAILSACKVTS